MFYHHTKYEVDVKRFRNYLKLKFPMLKFCRTNFRKMIAWVQNAKKDIKFLKKKKKIFHRNGRKQKSYKIFLWNKKLIDATSEMHNWQHMLLWNDQKNLVYLRAAWRQEWLTVQSLLVSSGPPHLSLLSVWQSSERFCLALKTDGFCLHNQWSAMEMVTQKISV